MKRPHVVLAAACLVSLSLPALADDKCPEIVKANVAKAFPGSIVQKCEMEKHDGKETYEVKLKTRAGDTTRLDLDTAGLILLTEQRIALEGVPVVVMKTFKTKYPDYKVTRTERWTSSDGKVTYRVTYARDGANRVIVYTNEGVFVEELEAPLIDEDMD